jgi:hypothetical protein
VQRGRGGTQPPQPRCGRDGGDLAAAGQDRHQQHRHPGRGAVKVDSQQPWRGQLLGFRQPQRRRLGGQLLAAVGVADPKDRLDGRAALVDTKPPGPCTSPQPLHVHNAGADAHHLGRPAQHRLHRR